jgi:hypothetical protein
MRQRSLTLSYRAKPAASRRSGNGVKYPRLEQAVAPSVSARIAQAEQLARLRAQEEAFVGNGKAVPGGRRNLGFGEHATVLRGKAFQTVLFAALRRN